jgi:hypothetical protein
MQKFEETKISNKILSADNIELKAEYKQIQEELSAANDKVNQMEKVIEKEVNNRREICIYNVQNNILDYSIDIDPYNCYNMITIIGYDIEEPIERGDVQVLDHRENNDAIIKIKIVGSLFNLKISKLGWDSKNEDYYEEKVICQYDELNNKDILFNSVLSEGLAGEMISWEDKDGNKYTYYISDCLFR